MILRPACRLLAALSLTSIVGVKLRSTMAYPGQRGRMLGKKWEVRNFGVSGAVLLRNRDHPYHKTKTYTRAIAWKPDTVHPNAEGVTVIGQTVYHALTGKSAAPKVPVLK